MIITGAVKPGDVYKKKLTLLQHSKPGSTEKCDRKNMRPDADNKRKGSVQSPDENLTLRNKSSYLVENGRTV